MDKISFIINVSKNNLKHLQLLLKSLKDCLHNPDHEILIFIDSDNENINEYLISEKNNFNDLKIITHNLNPCVGYSRNGNLMVEIAKHNIISYLQSDMVISRNYDLNILNHLEDNCILSSTRIEPPLHGESDKTITKDFGLIPEDFKYNDFLDFADLSREDKNIQYFFAPYTFHKETWLKFGGYDTLFRRSREDSDFVQRCLHNGIKLKQTFDAIVYHFSCVSSRGNSWFVNTPESKYRNDLQRKADEREFFKFVRKWGTFSHEEKLIKYDVDLVVKNLYEGNMNQNLDMLMSIEPYVSRVWIDNIDIVENLIARNEYNDNVYANDLLEFSIEDWDIAKKFYNLVDYRKIYQYYNNNLLIYNIKLDLDFHNIRTYNVTELNEFNRFIFTIHSVIEKNPIGKYDVLGNTIDIISKIPISNKHLALKNPNFDYSLLTIK